MLIPLLTELILTQADGGGAAQGQSPGGLINMGVLVLMFGVIYFLMIRPANKQRREHQQLLSALKKNDEVVTSGGFYGKVISLDDKVVTLEISDKVKIRILRDRIAGRWVSAPESQK